MQLLLFVAVLAATAYPPAMSLHQEGLQGAFRYFASDSFYYLSVADRSADRPFFTFDGTRPTNGFHPLWQIYLERSFAIFDLDAGDQVALAAVTSIALVAIGTALFSLALLRLTRRAWLALLGAVPGVFYLAMPSLNPHHFAQWSFANGMESPLSIFFFGVLLFGLFVVRRRAAPSTRSLVALSAVLSAIVLSRLDDIFVFVPFLAYVAWVSTTRREAIRRVATVASVPAFAIGTYLLYNLLNAESLLPSSGSAKAQPLWALARNTYALWITALPFADPLGRGAVSWSSEAWRMVQMVVPAAAAVAWLVGQRMSFRPGEGTVETRQNGLVGLLSVYVLCKALYNFAMVGLWHQGQWYYPLSIMIFNLIAVVWVARLLDQRAESRQLIESRQLVESRQLIESLQPVESRQPAAASLIARLRERWPALYGLPGAAAAVAAAALVLVTANAFVDLKQSGRHQSRNFEFWLERSATRHLLEESCPGCGVVAFDDGIVAYSLDEIPTLNGLGLVLDREAQQARTEGRLLELAWERGHRLFVSVNYAMPGAAYASRTALRRHLAQNAHLADEALDAWQFEVAFRSPSTGVSFVRFEPTPAAAAKRAPFRRIVPRHAVGAPRLPATPAAPPRLGDEHARGPSSGEADQARVDDGRLADVG